jgi:hypothetical protein
MGQENNNAEEECGRFRLPLIDVIVEIAHSSLKADREFAFQDKRGPLRGTNRYLILFDEGMTSWQRRRGCTRN